MYNNKGFTLIEIVIVLTMIGILTAIAIPGLMVWQENYRVNSAAQGIRSAFQLAKTTAIRNQATVSVNFAAGVGNAGSYIVFFDDNSNGLPDGGERIVRSEAMNRNITLYFPAAGSFPVGGGQFNSMGLPFLGSSGSVCVRNNTNTIFKRIRLYNTGNIKIEKSSTVNGPWVE